MAFTAVLNFLTMHLFCYINNNDRKCIQVAHDDEGMARYLSCTSEFHQFLAFMVW